MNRRSDDTEDFVPQRRTFEMSGTMIFAITTFLGFVGPAVAGFVTYKVFQNNIDMRVANAEEQVKKVPEIEIVIAEIKKDVGSLQESNKDIKDNLREIKHLVEGLYRKPQ